MANAAQFLELVASVTDDADDAVAYLSTMLEKSETPYEVRLELIKIVTTLRVQNMLVRRLSESTLDWEDKLNDLLERHNLNID